MRIPQLIYEFLCVYYNSYTNVQASVAAVGGGGGAARLVPHWQDRREQARPHGPPEQVLAKLYSRIDL